MVIFLFSTKNTLFVQIWSKKTRVVSLSWNLVSRIIRLCRIHWWCSLLQFLTGNIFFGDKFGPKNQNCQFKLKFYAYTTVIQVWRIRWWCSLFVVFDRKDSFFVANLFQKIKIICWRWNLEPRLILICGIWWWFSIFRFLDQKLYFSIN